MTSHLLATADTLDGIRETVTRFYGGDSKTLIPTGNDSWKAIGTYTGKEAPGVRVIRKRGRFRFEMTGDS
jgi:hypothetical protein